MFFYCSHPKNHPVSKLRPKKYQNCSHPEKSLSTRTFPTLKKTQRNKENIKIYFTYVKIEVQGSNISHLTSQPFLMATSLPGSEEVLGKLDLGKVPLPNCLLSSFPIVSSSFPIVLSSFPIVLSRRYFLCEDPLKFNGRSLVSMTRP